MAEPHAASVTTRMPGQNVTDPPMASFGAQPIVSGAVLTWAPT